MKTLLLHIATYLVLVHGGQVLYQNSPARAQTNNAQPAGAQDVSRAEKQRLATQSVSEGKALGLEWKKASLQEAINKYGDAYLRWQSLGNQREAAETQEAVGELQFILSEYYEAIDSYHKALMLRRRMGDKLGIAGTLNNIAYVYVYLGDNRRALSYLNQAMRYFNGVCASNGSSPCLRLQGQLRNSLGEVYYSLSDEKKALDSFSRSLALWKTLGDRQGEALATLNLGYMFSNFGDLQGAREHYDRARSLWMAAGNKRGEALCTTAIGGIHFFLGEQQVALDRHNEALNLFRSIGDREGEAATLNGIGTAYEGLNKPQEALDNYERARSLFHEVGNRDYEALSIFYIGAVHRALGETEQALNYYYQSLGLLQQVGDQRIETHVLKDLATMYSSAGQTQRALSQYQRVLRLYTGFEDKRGKANTLVSIGDIYALSGQMSRARALYKQALSLTQAAEDRRAEISTRYKIAQAERELGNFDQASTEMEAALKLVEEMRTKAGGPDLRASYFASVHRNYEQYVELLMDMQRRNPGADFAATALYASERSRARSLLEMLSEAKVDLRQGAEPALLEEADRVERSLDAKGQFQMHVLSAAHTKEDSEQIERQIRETAANYERLQNQIREQSSLYATITQPRILQLEEIQAELKDQNTLLLEFALGDERSHLWAITSTSFESYELPGRMILENAAVELYGLLTARQPVTGEAQEDDEKRVAIADSLYWPRAATLSRMLLEPVAKQLGNRRLIIVAEGTLQYIPFEALPLLSADREGPASRSQNGGPTSGQQTLVDEHEILYLQSASMLYALRRDRRAVESEQKGIAVLADPVFATEDPRVRSSAGYRMNEKGSDTAEKGNVKNGSEKDIGLNLARLPSTLREAELITNAAPDGATKVITGFDANKTAAMSSDLGQYKVVHFATHAIINNEHPELSGIVLSLVDQQGNAQSGFLRLPDVYKLKLNSDLIVLSGCRSALGKSVSGEGFVGLTRGFTSAGARSIVASLWKVDDEATAELMNHFYQAMFKEGLPPAAALQKAKQAMQANPAWHHPYYWAAFVLQGEYREGIQIGSSSAVRTPVVIALVTATTLLVFGLYVWSRRKRTMRVRE